MKYAIVLALATVGLSGCASLKSITPEQATNLVNAFASAGCKGSVNISFGGATGQLGGGFHADNTLNGQCDPASAHVVASGPPPNNPPSPPPNQPPGSPPPNNPPSPPPS